MTEIQKQAIDANEKHPLKSKKFIKFLYVETGFFILMAMMLLEQEVESLANNMAFMVLAITAGFLAVGSILGQASLDRYVRVAQITMGKGTPEEKE